MKREKVSINKNLFLTAAAFLILAVASPARAQSQGDGCSNANQVVSIDRPGIPALYCNSGTLQNFFIAKENDGMSCTAAREGAMQYIAATDTWNFCNGSAWTAFGGAASSLALSALTAATGTNTINSGANAQEWQWNTLAGASALKLSSTSTAAASNAQKMLEIALSGANATASQTTYGAYITNTHTGTSSTNVGLYASASGGTKNYAALFPAGQVGIGTVTPSGGDLLTVQGGNITSNAGNLISATSGNSWRGYLGMSMGTGGDGVLELFDDAGSTSKVLLHSNGSSYLMGGNVGIGTTSPQAQLDIAGTGALITPRGTTAQRPGTGINGMIRYNSQTAKFEGYQAGAWTNMIGGGSGAAAIDDLSDAFTDYTTEHNLIMGRTSAAALTAGAAGNLFIGENAGATTANSTAATDSNVAVGISALRQLTSGTLGTAVGAYALRNNTSGQFNTAFGAYALFTNSTNGSNTAVGYNALYNNTAAGITAVGYSALTDNTTGNENVAMGYSALATNKAGTGGTAIGYQAMRYANDTAVSTTTYNTAVGAYALQGSTTPANNTGTYNTAIGHEALRNNTSGGFNAALGQQALYGNTTGIGNIGVGSGALKTNSTNSYNIAIGTNALYSTTGASNVAIGDGAGYSGTPNTTGSNNTLIGYGAQVSANNLTNATALGNGAIVSASNMMMFGNSSVTVVRTNGHLESKGTAPTQSGTTCGNASFAALGNDNAFKISKGTTASTTCTVNFSATWTNAPICSVTPADTTLDGAIVTVTPSTTQLTFTHATSHAAGVFYVICQGYY